MLRLLTRPHTRPWRIDGRGLRGSALGCSARAEALAERCGARTPALGQASERLPLTDREREVVMLIGVGLSNRDVAARLTISVRTVERHIYNAMAKTGTGSREDLATLIRSTPVTHPMITCAVSIGPSIRAKISVVSTPRPATGHGGRTVITWPMN